MQITVFGATGRTGRPLVRGALKRGHDVVAHVRSPEKLAIEDDALTVVVGDVYSGEGVAEALEGADAVVSVLGQTSAGPNDLLTVAGDHVTDAMADAGVERYLTLVGAGVRTHGESVSLSGRLMGVALKLLAREVLEDAKRHAELVQATDLRWTIVRAPRLTDGPGTGDYRAGDIELGFESIDRTDVAAFLLDCIESDRYVHELPKVGQA